MQLAEIKEVRAVELFGDKARDRQQLVYVITGKIGGKENQIAAISKPPFKEISSKSKLAKFNQRYGKWPCVGLKVDVETNQMGFWTIIL